MRWYKGHDPESSLEAEMPLAIPALRWLNRTQPQGLERPSRDQAGLPALVLVLQLAKLCQSSPAGQAMLGQRYLLATSTCIVNSLVQFAQGSGLSLQSSPQLIQTIVNIPMFD